MRRARAFAPANAGNNVAARMAMMAMTTSSSINVKARRGLLPWVEGDSFMILKDI
jgi:hypothetical protein